MGAAYDGDGNIYAQDKTAPYYMMLNDIANIKAYNLKRDFFSNMKVER